LVRARWRGIGIRPREEQQDDAVRALGIAVIRSGRRLERPVLRVVGGDRQLGDPSLPVALEESDLGEVEAAGERDRYAEFRDADEEGVVVDRLRPRTRLDDDVGALAVRDEMSPLLQQLVPDGAHRVFRIGRAVARGIEILWIDEDLAARRNGGLELGGRVIDGSGDEELLGRRLVRFGRPHGGAAGKRQHRRQPEPCRPAFYSYVHIRSPSKSRPATMRRGETLWFAAASPARLIRRPARCLPGPERGPPPARRR